MLPCSEDGLITAKKPWFLDSSHFDNELDPSRVWNSWMTAFSTKEFTFERDRMAASAGFTKWFQKHYHWSIILGLPKAEFVRWLGWRLSRPIAPRSEPQTNKADIGNAGTLNIPSWSWFSLACHAAVSFPPFNPSEVEYDLDALQVISLIVEWEADELTSPLRRSELVVEGVLVDMEFQELIQEPEERRLIGPPSSANIEGHHLWKTPNPTPLRPEPWPKTLVHISYDVQLDVNKPEARPFEEHRMSCLVVQSAQEVEIQGLKTDHRQGFPFEVRFNFLILEEVKSRQVSPVMKQYKRLGAGSWAQLLLEQTDDISEFRSIMERPRVRLELV